MNPTVVTILNLILSILGYGGLVVLTIHQRVVERGEEQAWIPSTILRLIRRFLVSIQGERRGRRAGNGYCGN
jgi:hypothetical protein